MSKQLEVEVVDRVTTLWEGRASYVSVPALDGKLGVLPGRQPVLAVLGEGTVDITGINGGSGDVHISVSGGFVSIDSDFVTVVVETGAVIGS